MIKEKKKDEEHSTMSQGHCAELIFNKLCNIERGGLKDMNLNSTYLVNNILTFNYPGLGGERAPGVCRGL